MAEQRRSLRWVGLLATTLLLGACIEDPHVTLDKDLNAVRLRSVKISASACRERGPNEKSKKCDAISHYDLMRVSQMRGIIGAPLKAVAVDNDADAAYNYRYGLYGYWARIPTGYGCKATLQGIFPSPSKVKTCSDAGGCSAKTGAAGQQCIGQCVAKYSDPDKIDNYELGTLESLIGGVDNALSSIIWTAGYNIGDGLSTCTYGVGGKGGSPPFKYAGQAVPEHLGTPIEDPAKWAKVVRKVTRWYNRELPKLANNTDPSCKIATPTANNPRSWRCDPSLFNIEFGRDPNGAGGFTNSTKTKWTEAYRQFAKELRAEFPFPHNQASTPVNLMAPSVVVDESILAPTAKSWLFDFVDFAAGQKLPLSFLTFEVVARNPVVAEKIVRRIHEYVTARKLKNELGEQMPLFVMDLRLDPSDISPAIVNDPARYSAYEGAFFAATKMLWQGLVYGATMGRAMRFPTLPPSATPDDISKTALESNLMWFPDNNVPPHGTLKPASWHSFWFNSGFLGGGAGRYAWCKPGTGSGKACQKNEDCKKSNINEVCGGDKKCRVDCSDIAAEKRRKSMLKVQHGPDAVGLSGIQKSDTNDLLIGIATRENCVDSQGKPLDCVIEATDSEGNVQHSFPAATQGRRRIIRAMVADLNQASANKKGTEVLEHQLRVQVDDIPNGIKTVGFRWARMSGQRLTWCDSNNPKSCPFVFPEQGVLDVHNGSFSITKSIAVPSLHYFEFLY